MLVRPDGGYPPPSRDSRVETSNRSPAPQAGLRSFFGRKRECHGPKFLDEIRRALDAARDIARSGALDECDVADIEEIIAPVETELRAPRPRSTAPCAKRAYRHIGSIRTYLNIPREPRCRSDGSAGRHRAAGRSRPSAKAGCLLADRPSGNPWMILIHLMGRDGFRPGRCCDSTCVRQVHGGRRA
jgi:hypothetical protein